MELNGWSRLVKGAAGGVTAASILGSCRGGAFNSAGGNGWMVRSACGTMDMFQTVGPRGISGPNYYPQNQKTSGQYRMCTGIAWHCLAVPAVRRDLMLIP